jgi:hypothetical protein
LTSAILKPQRQHQRHNRILDGVNKDLTLFNKINQKQFCSTGKILFVLLLVAIGFHAASAATEAMHEYWSVFLIEEDDVNGAVAIYGNKVARRSFYTPFGHLVIIDLLDGSERLYLANTNVTKRPTRMLPLVNKLEIGGR